MGRGCVTQQTDKARRHRRPLSEEGRQTDSWGSEGTGEGRRYERSPLQEINAVIGVFMSRLAS